MEGKKKTAVFRQLLARDEILVCPGVFDGYSAKLVEQAGFDAACTTGAGLSNSRFGQSDTGLMDLTANVDAIRYLARSISIPLTADADTGYGNPMNVFHTVRMFEETGVAGINIEDQVSPKRCGHMANKDVIPLEEMVRKIEAACHAREDDDFVIVARTDAIAVSGLDDAIGRMKAYRDAGADMIFPDAVPNEDAIARIVDEVRAPITINMGFGVRSRPTTPLISTRRLEALGVKRVSLPRMLPAAAIVGMRSALGLMKESVATGEVIDRPDLLASFEEIQELMDYDAVRALEQELVYAPLKPRRVREKALQDV
jgi:2-methylisocitrate lyase-like PEP mutase family enzyme